MSSFLSSDLIFQREWLVPKNILAVLSQCCISELPIWQKRWDSSQDMFCLLSTCSYFFKYAKELTTGLCPCQVTSSSRSPWCKIPDPWVKWSFAKALKIIQCVLFFLCSSTPILNTTYIKSAAFYIGRDGLERKSDLVLTRTNTL